ncbi:hypothetical protein NONO_c41520 [Nocardia nova SH22a]|uniref:Uncharacterized protein n=1 Tax=Nocardia nova SH22a TaxID=1415166 RepID=W5TNY1_9NOCA|nr:hypothetical protein [Nocardia nova]AHH18936.1 hypothetical protein NONO_c41520 [Nocardia nova SH22a]
MKETARQACSGELPVLTRHAGRRAGAGDQALPTRPRAKRNIKGRRSDQWNVSINGLSVAQQRAALRRLVVAFGELNTIVDLAAGTPDLRARAESTRDLLGELVAEMAHPGGDRSCAVPADRPDVAGGAVARPVIGARPRRTSRIGGIGKSGKVCGPSAFDLAARRLGLRTTRRPH